MGSIGDGLVGLPIWLLGTNLVRTGGFFMTGRASRLDQGERDGWGRPLRGGAAGVEITVTRDFAITAGGATGARFDGGTWGSGFVSPTILF
jgi:hypothetical protein